VSKFEKRIGFSEFSSYQVEKTRVSDRVVRGILGEKKLGFEKTGVR